MHDDSRLQRAVHAEIQWRRSVDAAPIRVVASNGVVTLTGAVPTIAEKLAAQEAAAWIALSLPGETTIRNELTIAPR